MEDFVGVITLREREETDRRVDMDRHIIRERLVYTETDRQTRNTPIIEMLTIREEREYSNNMHDNCGLLNSQRSTHHSWTPNS